MTMTDILNFINESQISKVQLELRHVEQLVNALEYDGKVEKIKNPRAISVRFKIFKVTLALD